MSTGEPSVYLVGGAVRDQLLGRPVLERDWVVVGASPEWLLQQGYTPIAKDFPIFLHPITKEEYALARTERKTQAGYYGFSTQSHPQISLEDDLKRRDLTINAMALSADGKLIDPYGGQRDLEARVLRHVSQAFLEDPVRLLRVARFLARFQCLGFRIAPETLELMKAMVQRGEIQALVPERVWQELWRALQEPAPEAFFKTLIETGAMPVLWPGLTALHTPQAPSYACLNACAAQSRDAQQRWLSLFIPALALPETELQRLKHDLKMPVQLWELTRLMTRHGQEIWDMKHQSIPSQIHLLMRVDAFRRPARFLTLVDTLQNSLRGTHLNKWVELLPQLIAIRPADTNLPGQTIQENLRQARVEYLNQHIQDN